MRRDNMENDKIIMTIKIASKKIMDDIEVPKTITANDLIVALNASYQLEIDTENMFHNYLKTENPIVLLRGNRTLEEFGLHDGTMIIINE